MKQSGFAVDPVTFEILSHRIYQITMEMGTTLERVGGTVNTTQMKDYIAALYLPNGDVLCAGSAMVWHVPCAGTAVKAIIERFGKEGGINPGDMFLLNDPYVAAIHQSDVYIVSPIHYENRLVGWSATFVHVMDIGAMSPGGNSPGATEICHEGVRIAGIKLIDGGKLRKDVFDAITNMTRQPVMVGLDLKCEIAANNVARTRMQEMYAQYGANVLGAICGDMVKHTETVLRKRLADLPDGEWRAHAMIESGETWNVRLTLRKCGDQLIFDFEGTDPQAKVGINLPYHATVGACFEAVLSTLGYDLPKNQGLFGVMDVRAPQGSLVNVVNPGPVSLNTTSGGAIARYLANTVMAQMAARSEKWRVEVLSQSMGNRLARHAGVNQFDRYYVSTLVGLGGGGARSYADGIDSSGMETGGTSSCHNVEWVEANFPLLHIFRRHVCDSAGAGKFRGGVAEETALVLHDSPTNSVTFVALGTSGLRNGGQGIFGGYNGAPSVLVHMTDTTIRNVLSANQAPVDLDAVGGNRNVLPYCSINLTENDVFLMRFAGGGGYGDPLERDPDLVERDVENGLVSKNLTEPLYGVVLDRALKVDVAATEKRREQMRNERISLQGTSRSAPRTKSLTPTTHGQPLQEGLAVSEVSGTHEVHCTRCAHVLSKDQDWRSRASIRRVPPSAIGPLMGILGENFVVEQRSCPACGVLLSTDVLAEKSMT